MVGETENKPSARAHWHVRSTVQKNCCGMKKNRNRTARVWPWWLSLHAISDENNNSIAIFWTFFNNELPRKFSVTLLILFPNGQGFGAIISGEHSQSLNLIIMVPVCEFTVKIKSSIRILKWNKKNNNKKKGKIQW